jgi:hypothetical protein
MVSTQSSFCNSSIFDPAAPAAGEITTKVPQPSAHESDNLEDPAGTTMFGNFSTKFVAGKGNGVVTSFFLNMDEGPQGNFQTKDAISLEILGHNSTYIHYYSMVDKVLALSPACC